jgi:hypothetical protein
MHAVTWRLCNLDVRTPLAGPRIPMVLCHLPTPRARPHASGDAFCNASLPATPASCPSRAARWSGACTPRTVQSPYPRAVYSRRGRKAPRIARHAYKKHHTASSRVPAQVHCLSLTPPRRAPRSKPHPAKLNTLGRP